MACQLQKGQHRTNVTQSTTATPEKKALEQHPTGLTHLSLLGLVTPVLGEEVGEDVAAAAGDVDEGAFLAQAEASRHRQHHPHRLDQQRPLAQVAPDDEATQNGLDLQVVYVAALASLVSS